MQILGSKSQEGNCEGLNFIPGDILKFPENKNIICPHVGWNKIHFQENKLCRGLENDTRVYFSHSYYFVPKEKKEFINVYKLWSLILFWNSKR